MRKIFLIAVIALFVAAPAVAEDSSGVATIAGAAIGYAVDGETEGNRSFATYFAGLKLKSVGDGALYTVVQQLKFEGGATGTGAKIILQDPIGATSFSLLLDVGFASGMATNSDGTTSPGLTVGGGLHWKAGDVLGVVLYGQGVDRGTDFSWMVNFGITGTKLLQKLGIT